MPADATLPRRRSLRMKDWESIVRSEQHYRTLQQYIANNPAQWTLDQLFEQDAEGHFP